MLGILTEVGDVGEDHVLMFQGTIPVVPITENQTVPALLAEQPVFPRQRINNNNSKSCGVKRILQ